MHTIPLAQLAPQWHQPERTLRSYASMSNHSWQIHGGTTGWLSSHPMQILGGQIPMVHGEIPKKKKSI